MALATALRAVAEAAPAPTLHQFRHDVTVANSRGPASLADLGRKTGARAVTVEDAGRDVVVVTIPLKRVEALPPGLFAGAPADLVVIDTGNYYPQQRDGCIEAGLTESGWVEQRLGRPVVKAFNTIIAQHLQDGGKPAGAPGRIGRPVGAPRGRQVRAGAAGREGGGDTPENKDATKPC